MSIHDLTHNKNILPAIMVGLFIGLIIVIPILKVIINKYHKSIYGDRGDTSYPLLTENAKIISKRVTPYQIPIYYIGFELENNTRIELAIKDKTKYGILVEGDRGKLTYRGKVFIDFQIEPSNDA